MIQLNFEPINLDRQSAYLDRFNECSQKASDYSFTNLWGWAEEYGLYWAWTEQLVYLKQTRPETCYWAPVGPWERIDWARFFERHTGEGAVYERVPEDLLGLWNAQMKNRLTALDSRGHWDYLYSAPALAALSGKRFHKKKNLLNQFKKQYIYQYVPMGPEIVEMALAMQEDWCMWRDCESSESLAAENNVIHRVLSNSGNLPGLMGGAIIIEKKVAAYTVAERLDEDTLLIHFEKGCPEYKGIYQAINNIFLNNIGNKIKMVNREQDLNDEGLRKAKLSYHPVDYVRKYRVALSF